MVNEQEVGAAFDRATNCALRGIHGARDCSNGSAMATLNAVHGVRIVWHGMNLEPRIEMCREGGERNGHRGDGDGGVVNEPERITVCTESMRCC